MIQEVHFQGLSHSPSDHDAKDGELGTCYNLICEDGALKPLPKPEVTDSNITIPDGATIELVHKVTHNGSIHSHYVVKMADGSWCWAEKDSDGILYTLDLDGFSANTVAAVGNILCFVGSNKTIYGYWTNGRYTILDLSSINYSGTATRVESDELYDVIEPNDTFTNFEKVTDGNGKDVYKFKDSLDASSAQKLFQAKDAYLNRKMDLYTFKYIQFGVLALRLYDGSYIQIGNPFTITDGSGANSDIYLWVSFGDGTIEGSISSLSVSSDKTFAIHKKQSLYKYSISVSFDDIAKYADIIDGIDVFVSDSIYPYNTNLQINTKQKDYVDGGVEKLTINTEEYGTLVLVTALNFLGNDKGVFLGHWNYPALTSEELNQKVENLTFYKSVSLSFNDIQNNKTIQLKQIQQTEETLSLADVRRSSYGAKVATTYNNRLHLANIYSFVSNAVNGYVSTSSSGTIQAILHVKYKQDGQVTETYDIHNLGHPLDPFVGFPCDNIILYEIYAKVGDTYRYQKFDAYNNSTFGFSYYLAYNGSGRLVTIDLTKSNQVSAEAYNSVYNTAISYEGTAINSPSLVKVSEAENPLVFPASNSVQVGSSIISALAANTQSISEGQFGEAPLYAFTDEGVWSLMVSSTGTYQARQPVNRDICSNPKSILQIDDAVLYPTDRGIMMLQGRNAVCITDQLDGYPFDFTQLYKNEYSKKVLAIENISEDAIKYARFRTYLQSAQMIYDYYDNRIIVFNSSYDYAYVYSLKSKQWGTMQNNLRSKVNIYPESYAVNTNGKIVNMYTKEPTKNVSYLLCSRPLALSNNEVFKTIFSCITRGYFRNEKGRCGMILYGSNDLFHWFPIKTSVNKYLRGSAGSPYKYFRIAITGHLSVDESISGMSADLTERWQNKLR